MNWTKAAILPSGVDGLAEAAAAGFTHVELEALADRPAGHLDALAEAGVFVAAVRLSGALHVADVPARSAALRNMKRQIDDAARLGVFVAYLPAGAVEEGAPRAYFSDACRLLAEHAEGRGVNLAVGGLRGALEWLREEGGEYAGLAALGDEDELARGAGARLWYVRNPGKALLATLRALGYDGTVAVALHSPHTSSSTSSAT